MNALVSVYMWAVWGLFIGLGSAPLVLILTILPRRLSFPVARLYCKLGLGLAGVRVRVKGLEHLDRTKPYILMPNHVSLLDAFVFCTAFPVPVRGLEKRENFKIPVYGWLMARYGQIPIDRTNTEQAKRDLSDAARILHQGGTWVIILPEGTRSRDGRVGPFKKGGFHLALETGVDIVPVSQNGSREVLRTVL